MLCETTINQKTYFIKQLKLNGKSKSGATTPTFPFLENQSEIP